MRALCSLVLMLGILFVSQRPAHADWPWGFVKVSCIPEISYFSIQRFTVMNIPHSGAYLDGQGLPRPEVAEALRHREGLFDSSQYLKDHPYTCKIPDTRTHYDQSRPAFEVTVTGRYNVSPDESDYSHMLDEVVVLLNGQKIGTMGLNPYGLGVDDDTISVAPNGVGIATTVCSLPTDPLSQKADDPKTLKCVDKLANLTP